MAVAAWPEPLLVISASSWHKRMEPIEIAFSRRFTLRLELGEIGTNGSPALWLRLMADGEPRSRIIVPLDYLDKVIAGLTEFKASIAAEGTTKEFGW